MRRIYKQMFNCFTKIYKKTQWFDVVVLMLEMFYDRIGYLLNYFLMYM